MDAVRSPAEARNILHELNGMGDQDPGKRLDLVRISYKTAPLLQDWHHWVSRSEIRPPVDDFRDSPIGTAEALTLANWRNTDEGWRVSLAPQMWVHPWRLDIHPRLVSTLHTQRQVLSNHLSLLYGHGQQTYEWHTGAIGTGKTWTVKTALQQLGIYSLNGVAAPDEVKGLLREEIPGVTDDALQSHSGVVTKWVGQQQPPAEIVMADGLATPEKLTACAAGSAIVHIIDSWGDAVNAMNSVLCRPADGAGGPHMPFSVLAESHVRACALRHQLFADPFRFCLSSLKVMAYVPDADPRRQLVFEYIEGQTRIVNATLYHRISTIRPDQLRSDLISLGNTVVTPDNINRWMESSAREHGPIIQSIWNRYLGNTVAKAFALRAREGIV